MAKTQKSRTPVIGVGASAGGVEALEGFLRGIPADPGFAVVVVTHLSPDRESHLKEILSRHTVLSVQAVKHDVLVKPNCVYVLSAEALVGIERGRLQLQDAPTGRRERKPIDIFLSSLATDLGEYGGAVILSGGDGDGTLSAKAVKERGGITLAQVRNGDGPSHPDMPDSAISTGFVDFAIPADEMGAKLVEFVRGLKLLDGMADDEKAADAEGLASALHRDIYSLLRNQVGHDFSGYKSKTFMRRVQRRMQVVQLSTVDAYVEHLRQDPREVNALFRDLPINVTNFFRDADAFEKLKELVIPKLFENRGADDTVRIWVPGCATGEEVFSIAMLVREHLDTLNGQPRVQIFATDIDERALNVARAARYPEALLDTVSPERLERFFIKDAGSYVLTKDVRDLCVFSPHSVIRDPPFSRIDLVSCRNLLIYFGPDVQSQVVPTFHYSLRAGGYLFLGTSENVSQFTDLFTALDKKHRIAKHSVRVFERLRYGRPARAPQKRAASFQVREPSPAPEHRGPPDRKIDQALIGLKRSRARADTLVIDHLGEQTRVNLRAARGTKIEDVELGLGRRAADGATVRVRTTGASRVVHPPTTHFERKRSNLFPCRTLLSIDADGLRPGSYHLCESDALDVCTLRGAVKRLGRGPMCVEQAIGWAPSSRLW